MVLKDFGVLKTVKRLVNQKNLKLVLNKKLRFKEAGFTLVEMTVVMAIIAVIMLLGAFGMQSARKQVGLKAAAKELQSNIRLSANNAISVAPNRNDGSKMPKSWGIEIPCSSSTASYNLVDFHTPTIASPIVMTKSFRTVQLQNGVTIDTRDICGSDNLYLTFNTPFANFSSFEAGNSINSINWLVSDTSKSYSPIITKKTGVLSLKLKNDSPQEAFLKINALTGEASINNNQ